MKPRLGRNTYPGLTGKMMDWYKRTTEKGGVVSLSEMKVQAILFAKQLGYRDFKTENNWFWHLKKKMGVPTTRKSQIAILNPAKPRHKRSLLREGVKLVASSSISKLETQIDKEEEEEEDEDEIDLGWTLSFERVEDEPTIETNHDEMEKKVPVSTRDLISKATKSVASKSQHSTENVQISGKQYTKWQPESDQSEPRELSLSITASKGFMFGGAWLQHGPTRIKFDSNPEEEAEYQQLLKSTFAAYGPLSSQVPKGKSTLEYECGLEFVFLSDHLKKNGFNLVTTSETSKHISHSFEKYIT